MGSDSIDPFTVDPCFNVAAPFLMNDMQSASYLRKLGAIYQSMLLL